MTQIVNNLNKLIIQINIKLLRLIRKKENNMKYLKINNQIKIPLKNNLLKI